MSAGEDLRLGVKACRRSTSELTTPANLHRVKNASDFASNVSSVWTSNILSR